MTGCRTNGCLAVTAMLGFAVIHRFRNELEQWMTGVGIAAVIIVGACAGHPVSHYESTVQKASAGQTIRKRIGRWHPELLPEKTEHPCQFPVELVERLVLSMTKRDDWVLDPFLGSGTSIIAAVRHGLR